MQEQQQQQSLIPNLPDDVALLCLLRVPRAYHKSMRWVCKAWSGLVSSGSLCAMRRASRLAEPWLYIRSRDSRHCNVWRCFDTATGTWNKLPPPPYSFAQPHGLAQVRGLGSAAVGGKLFVFGGWREGGPALSEVWCYDPIFDSWTAAAPMGTARCYMAYAVVGGRIMVAGGMSRPCLYSTELLVSTEVYDADVDKWTKAPDMLDPILLSCGISFQDHFLISGNFARDMECGQVFHPSDGCWRLIANRSFAAGLGSPCAAYGRHLFCMRETLQLWDFLRGEWEAVGDDYKLFSVDVPSDSVADMLFVGDKLFMVHRNSSVTMVEFEKEGIFAQKPRQEESREGDPFERSFYPWSRSHSSDLFSPGRAKPTKPGCTRWARVKSVVCHSLGPSLHGETGDEEASVCYAIEA